MDMIFTGLTPGAWRPDEDVDLPVGGTWEKRWREKPVPLPLATSRAVQHPFTDSAVTKLHRYFDSVSFYLAHGHTVCPTACSMKTQDHCVTGTVGKGSAKGSGHCQSLRKRTWMRSGFSDSCVFSFLLLIPPPCR